MRATSNKQSSPRKSATPHSLSLEDPHPEPPLTRRRTREQDPDDIDSPKVEDIMEDEEDEQEVTRCVCTFLEYPGPPAIAGRAKDGLETDIPPEEGSLFIQCDTCKHRSSIDEFFAARRHPTRASSVAISADGTLGTRTRLCDLYEMAH